jgi:tetratricopeptide (TPR) repeat protein
MICLDRARTASFAAAACLALAAVVSTAPAGAVDTAPEAEITHPDLTAARAAIKLKDFKRAVKLLDRVVGAEPKNADAYNLLGFSQRNLGNLQQALTYYNIALSLDPKHLGAHEYIGEAYLRMNNVAKAEEHLAVLQKLCRDCDELRDLRASIAAFRKK